MRAIISIFIIFILSSSLFSQLRDNYLSARACMVEDNYDSALYYLDKALSSGQGEVEMLYARGVCHFEKQQYGKAFEDFFQVERRRTGMASLYLAKTEIHLNHPEQAIKYLRIHLSSRYRVPEKDILLDDDLSTLESRADWRAMWNEKNWYNQNDRDYQQAIFLKETADYLDAINLLNDLEKRGYNKSEVQTLKAEMFGMLGNEKAMASEIEKAVASDVRNHKALEIRARYLVKNGKFEDAITDCDKMIRLDPANFDAYLVRSSARSGAGDLEGALEDIDQYILYFPRNDSAYFLKGKIQYNHKKYLNAIQSFNMAMKLDSGKAEYYHYRGLVYSRTGTLNYAEKDFSMALDLDPLNGETWLEKGKISARLGKIETACHDYKKAYQYGNYEARDFIDKNCSVNE